MARARTFTPHNERQIPNLVTHTPGPVFNVRDPQFNAKGDGTTNDQAAIESAVADMRTAGRGVLYFPAGSYSVEFDDTTTTYYSLFEIGSNSAVVFDRNASLTVNGSDPAAYAAVFGPYLTGGAISNIGFYGVDITWATTTHRNGINLLTAQDAAAELITNVTIDGCRFTDCGSGVFIVQRHSTGATTRQVKGVKVVNCFAEGCLGSFVTADGEDIYIGGNTAIGHATTPASAYDAVSIHSGIDVRVIGNTFSYYAAGQPINVRNSSENLCGSERVVIANNTLHNVATSAIQVSVVSGESTYGVKDVTIANNVIHDAATGIVLNRGTADAGTPMHSITVTGNQIETTATGINCIGASSLRLLWVKIADNFVRVAYGGTAVTAGYGLRMVYADQCTINGNTIYSNNDTGHSTISLGNLGLCTVNSNVWYSADDTVSPSIVISTAANSSFVGNFMRGIFSFSTVTTSLVEHNTNITAGTANGHSVSAVNWGIRRGLFYNTSTAAPGTGTWVQGDIIYNSSPAASGYYGWICTTAGTPGTWRGFGAIAA